MLDSTHRATLPENPRISPYQSKNGLIWADRVAGQPRPTGSTTPTATAAVSCADPPTAMELADELLAGGPDQVDRLHAFATLSARRAAAAAEGLTEPDPDRLARTASAVRQVWAGPRYTALAEAIVASPAFPALAWRLHELEERGYAFTDVLGRIDPDRLMGSNVRDPAALAEWFVEQMAPDLRVVNLDADDPAAASSRAASGTPTAGPAPTPHPSPPTPGPASATPAADPAGAAPGAARPSAPRVDAAAAAAQDAAVQPLLAGAYPPDLVQRLQGSRAYPRLRAYLHQLHQQGRPVAKTLGDVPAARLDGARDPASYLHAAVRRHPLAAPLQRSGPDRAAMADLVRAAMPKSVADKVVASTAWPVLARRLETWTAEGLPVADLLADLPAGRVFAARTPAAYAAHLMDLKVDAHRTGAQAQQDARAKVDRGRSTASTAASRSRSAGTAEAAGPTESTADKTTADTTTAATDEHTRTGTADDTRHQPQPSPADPRTCAPTRTSTCSTSSTRCPRRPTKRARPGRHRSPRPPRPVPVGPAAADRRTRGNERFLVGDYLVVDRAVSDADNVDSTRNDDVAIVVDGTVLWSEDLDPANAVDRVGLEATVGLGSAARAERVEARLDVPQTSPAAGADASTATTPRAITAGSATAAGSELVVQPKAAAEGLDAVLAGLRAATFGTGPAGDQAVVDPHHAAAERAEAAEQRGDPAAAAARAEVTCTPPAPDAAGRGAQGTRRVAPPVSPRPPHRSGEVATSVNPPMDLPAPAALPAAQVHALLDSGEAVPLLPGHRPVPVRIASRGWHVPAATEEPAANGGGQSYVAASPAQAAAYERLAARVDAAAAAMPRPQREPPP